MSSDKADAASGRSRQRRTGSQACCEFPPRSAASFVTADTDTHPPTIVTVCVLNLQYGIDPQTYPLVNKTKRDKYFLIFFLLVLQCVSKITHQLNISLLKITSRAVAKYLLCIGTSIVNKCKGCQHGLLTDEQLMSFTFDLYHSPTLFQCLTSGVTCGLWFIGNKNLTGIMLLINLYAVTKHMFPRLW